MKIYFVEDGDFPEMGTDVLFFREQRDECHMGWRNLDNIWWDRSGQTDSRVDDVICWTYLPEKPKRVQD